MKKNSNFIKKIFPLFLIFTVMGCNLPTFMTASTQLTPTVETVDFASTISAVQTESVGSVFQSLTQVAKQSPVAPATLRVTETPKTTGTAVPSFTPPPTTTPKPAATNTPVQPTVQIVYVTKAPTYTPTQGAFQCKITSLNPAIGTRLSNGVDFDLKVTLENVGTDTWDKDNLDFRYSSGAKFQTHLDALDLPNDVDPGDDVSFIVDMAATTGTGTQYARWILGNFCTVYISVFVKSS
jgi:hypothetical protein